MSMSSDDKKAMLENLIFVKTTCMLFPVEPDINYLSRAIPAGNSREIGFSIPPWRSRIDVPWRVVDHHAGYSEEYLMTTDGREVIVGLRLPGVLIKSNERADLRYTIILWNEATYAVDSTFLVEEKDLLL